MAWEPGITQTAGSTVAIGSSVASQSDELADTYTEISEITDVGSFGKLYTLVKFVSLSNRRERKFKGTYNTGSLSLKCGRDISDDGQAAVYSARDSDVNYNFRVRFHDESDTTATLSTNALTALGSKVLHFASTTGVYVGMSIEDLDSPGLIPTNAVVASLTSTTVTMNVAATGVGVDSGASVKFTSQPTTFYFGAKVMSFNNTVGGPNAIVMADINLEIDTEIAVVAAS